MFDYRYHALSLAAVLFALAVGVVIGVAIGDSNLVSSAKSGIVQNLRSDVSRAERQASDLSTQLAAEEAFERDLYPIAIHGLLTRRSIGLVFLGGSSDNVNGSVRDAVTQAGGDLVTVLAVREPLDLAGLARQAAGTRYADMAVSPQLVKQFGTRIGVQLVSDGKLLQRVHTRLLSSFDGRLGALDGLVVMRSDPSDQTPADAQAMADFQSGFLAGVTAAGIPTVGVELTSTDPSQVSWYRSQDIASVDDLDKLAGRTALVFALTGAQGSYGIKSTADSGLLPRVSTPAQP
ncbi:MAG TPA: copper transporter [Solirubrobacteraceae bacterium]|nr:copper transporter [Solirubrobacteraceae bacterium]